ncbi:hypothetical protein NL108_013145 [Boleophthalmus pectinirostris]|nr:hypothetical protein NL108_013145 [Boleophthalmus pectinirostris]
MFSGIVFANGKTWREMRRFVLTNLRDFGMGKRACEDKIIEECGHLLQRIKSFKGGPLDTSKIIPAALFNIICSMVFGDRFEYDDPEFKNYLYSVRRSIQLLITKSVQLYQIFPWIGKWVSKERAEIGRMRVEKEKLYFKTNRSVKEDAGPRPEPRNRGCVSHQTTAAGGGGD